jgi:uncharacterized membrane protein
MKNNKSWFIYALLTAFFWGIWGAFIELPEKNGFPPTLGYIVWAFTMLPCAAIALNNINWKIDIDKRSILLGSIIGLTGAGGQIILFQALKTGPAYIVFPLISLSPVLTIVLSHLFLKEKANLLHWFGIVISLIAIFLLSYKSPDDANIKEGNWLLLSILVFIAWGVQAYYLKVANNTMKAESIFFYMTAMGIFLAPLAYWMTDFSVTINYGFKGPGLAFFIHLLNSAGALMLVYAFRYGKAIVVAPLTGLAPVLTILISLALYGIVPGITLAIGIGLAVMAMWIFSKDG